MDPKVDEILKKITPKVDEAEIYTEKIVSTDVDILNDSVNHAKEEDIYGIGIRIIKDQRQGFAYTTNINRIDETINEAIRNSKLNDQDENLSMIDGNLKYKKVEGLYDKNLENVDLPEAIEYSQTLIDITKEEGCNPTSGGYGTSLSHVNIVNSNGVDVEEIQTGCGASISVNVEDNDLVSSAYYYDVSHTKDLNLDEIVKKATKLALDSRGAKPTTSRDSKVVLDHTAAVSLLSTFLSALNSENKQRGRSVFKDKLDEQVASEGFTLIDDGHIPKALRSSISDAEGTPTQKTILIEDGILKNFIYNTYRANIDDVKTTANAVRGGYTSVPSVGFTNLEFKFKDEYEISEIDDGIFVDSVMGAHTANPITGDFSVEVMNGFEIQNGCIENPIKKAMISGNIFDIMNTACAIKSDIRQLGSCILPQILAENLRITG